VTEFGRRQGRNRVFLQSWQPDIGGGLATDTEHLANEPTAVADGEETLNYGDGL
jgi:hypothetical protein